jgi:hypothetical protein
MRGRINGRSKGLLEIDSISGDKPSTLQEVSFLHRTVRDFLQIKEITTTLSQMSPHSFDASQLLARGKFAELKTGVTEVGELEDLKSILNLARKAEKNSGITDIALIDGLEHLS